jgi:hypothetical protein
VRSSAENRRLCEKPLAAKKDIARRAAAFRKTKLLKKIG